MFRREARGMMIRGAIMFVGALLMALLMPPIFRLLGLRQARRPVAWEHAASPGQSQNQQRQQPLEQQNNDAWTFPD